MSATASSIATAGLYVLTLAGDGEHTSTARFAWGDFDVDGHPDVFVADPTGGDRLYRSLGGGEFEEVSLALAGREPFASRFGAWMDVDGDGLLDLYASGSVAPGRLLRNAGGGAFEELSLPSMEGVVLDATFLDFDEDGRVDLELHGSVTSALLRNDGYGAFAKVALELPPMDPASVDSIVLASAPVDELPRPLDGRAALGGTGTTRSGGGSTLALGAPPTGGGSVGSAVPLLSSLPGCAKSIDDQAGGACILASSVPTLGSLFPLSSALNVTPTGWVGMGTTSPTHRLQVNGSMRSTGQVLADYGTATSPSFRFGPGGEVTGLSSPAPNTISLVTSGAERMHLTAAGRVGVGTNAPLHALDVTGAARATDRVMAGWGSSVYATYRFGDGSETSGLSSPATNTVSVITTGVERMRIDFSGNVGIGTTSPGAKLDILSNDATGTVPLIVRQNHATSNIVTAVNGSGSKVFEVKNSGRVVSTALQITGGGDLVEGFDAEGVASEPGSVVSIDPASPGSLVASSEPYDRRVAGVVSGAGGVNHGIRMGQDGVLDGDTLVAMAGRVWVKCSAENGAIAPGDLLTSATLAAHAMRATDPERSFGAVIGKAMTSLEAGTGLVLVLVNLQ